MDFAIRLVRQAGLRRARLVLKRHRILSLYISQSEFGFGGARMSRIDNVDGAKVSLFPICGSWVALFRFLSLLFMLFGSFFLVRIKFTHVLVADVAPCFLVFFEKSPPFTKQFNPGFLHVFLIYPNLSVILEERCPVRLH